LGVRFLCGFLEQEGTVDRDLRAGREAHRRSPGDLLIDDERRQVRRVRSVSPA
jgi:hypothetical protein